MKTKFGGEFVTGFLVTIFVVCSFTLILLRWNNAGPHETRAESPAHEGGRQVVTAAASAEENAVSGSSHSRSGTREVVERNSHLFTVLTGAQARAGLTNTQVINQRSATNNSSVGNGLDETSAQQAVVMNYPKLPLAYYAAGGQSEGAIEAQALQQIQKDFNASVQNGASWGPSDPAYRTHWESAQQAADDAYRAKFGTAAFMAMDAARYRQMLISTGIISVAY